MRRTNGRQSVPGVHSSLLLLGCLLATPGCRSTETTHPEEPGNHTSTGAVIFAGAIYDHRPPPSDPKTGLSNHGEVRIPANEIRSVLFHLLRKSNLFRKVMVPPAEFMGKTTDAMIARAQDSSDYLLVCEVNQFHVKSLGFNYRAGLSIPLDLAFAPVALAACAMTKANCLLFTGGLIASWTAEAVLSVSASLFDVSDGKLLMTLRLEERAQAPHDGRGAFGVFWDDSDDWLDLGRRLGEIALHNAGVHLADELSRELPSLLAPQDGQ